jgi:hypothetical protein
MKVLPLIAPAAALGTTGALAKQNQPQPPKPSGGAPSVMMGGKMAASSGPCPMMQGVA